MTLHALPVSNAKAREHVTVPIEEFAEKLGELCATAEDKGVRAALYAVETTPARHLAILSVSEETHAQRARLYAAQIMATLRGIAV